MKILLDARMFGLENTGVGRYIMNLVEELGKSDKKNDYVILLRKKYFHELKLPKNWTKVLADFRHYTIAEQIKLPRLISSYKPDLVHFPHFNIPILFRGKFIVTIHDMIMHNQGKDSTTLSLPLYYAKRILYRFIFKNAVISSAKIITPTETIKKQIKDYYKINTQKVRVIHEGINDDFIRRNLKGNEEMILRKFGLLHHKFFIYMGNAYPYKNLKRVIEALVLLNERSKVKFQFVIVTSRNVFAEKLKKDIKTHDADNFIKLLGFVEDNEMVYLLKNSIAFIYPSLSEGFGLQGLEAMAAGTLVLASEIPVFIEVYKNYASYFNPYDVSAIVKSMEGVIEINKQKKSILIKQSQEFVRHYSWTKMTKETQEVYEEVLKK